MTGPPAAASAPVHGLVYVVQPRAFHGAATFGWCDGKALADLEAFLYGAFPRPYNVAWVTATRQDYIRLCALWQNNNCVGSKALPRLLVHMEFAGGAMPTSHLVLRTPDPLFNVVQLSWPSRDYLLLCSAEDFHGHVALVAMYGYTTDVQGFLVHRYGVRGGIAVQYEVKGGHLMTAYDAFVTRFRSTHVDSGWFLAHRVTEYTAFLDAL